MASPADIAAGLAAVRTRMDAAARAAGRDPASVRLIAVSKTQPAEAVRAAYAAGQREFGENYAQELVEKAAALADLGGLVWHFIGALQRNKAKLVAPLAAYVHTVDGAPLADALERRATQPLRALIEVNLAGEAQKAGVPPAELAALLDALAGRPRLRVVGLMAIPPAGLDLAATRTHFHELARLAAELGRTPRPGVTLDELSMGMSADFEAAIAEGATLVRVGTAIFGARHR